MKCRKKPVTINAWPIAELIEAATNNWDNLPKEVVEFYETGGLVFTSNSISIATLEGHMIGDRLSWLLQGVMGEFYPCKPDAFEATYDLTEEGPACSECGGSGYVATGSAGEFEGFVGMKNCPTGCAPPVSS